MDSCSAVQQMCVNYADEPSTWIIADPHFDHANIIKYCNRPFSSVEEMNDYILCRWNNRIGQDDLVFFLGDMAFGRGSRSPRWWLRQLNGRKVYLKGSHDKGIRPTSQLGSDVLLVTDCILLKTCACTYLLIHDTFSKPVEYNGWVVHGHNHNNRPYIEWEQKRVNVSVEAIDYKPISVRQLVSDTVGVK